MNHSPYLLELRSDFLGTDGTTAVVTMAFPQIDDRSRDYFCRVESSGGLTLKVDAYGIAPSQALRSALEIIAAHIASKLAADDRISVL